MTVREGRVFAMLSNVDRMSAILLAKSIVDRRTVLALSGGIAGYIDRLSQFKMFSVGEIADISGLSEYQVRRASAPDVHIRAKSGISPRHLDHALRMVGNAEFSRLHVKSLLEDGATVAALARVTGQPERSLRRWAREE